MSDVGITFKGIHSSSFEIFIEEITRPLRAARREKTMVVQGRHGAYRFPGETYDSKIVQVKFKSVDKTKVAARLKVREIAEWLSGKGMLWFDDEPDKCYNAVIYSDVPLDVNYILSGFIIQFECAPFDSLKYKANDIILDSDLLLDSRIRLDDSYSFSINASGTVEVNNFGTFAVRPVIEITGSFSTFSISIGGKTLNYTEAILNETVKIDNDLYTVKKGTTNKLSVITGDTDYFLELQPGVNEITINGTGLNCTVLFDFSPLFL